MNNPAAQQDVTTNRGQKSTISVIKDDGSCSQKRTGIVNNTRLQEQFGNAVVKHTAAFKSIFYGKRECITIRFLLSEITKLPDIWPPRKTTTFYLARYIWCCLLFPSTFNKLTTRILITNSWTARWRMSKASAEA